MTRDSQRGCVYAAEKLMRQMLDDTSAPIMNLAGSTIAVPLERRFGEAEHAQRYADYVCDACGVSRCKIVAVDREGFAWYRAGVIELPTSWAMREIVLLHELAHHLTLGCAHGPEFVAMFVDLIETMMGFEAGFMARVLNERSGARQ